MLARYANCILTFFAAAKFFQATVVIFGLFCSTRGFQLEFIFQFFFCYTAHCDFVETELFVLIRLCNLNGRINCVSTKRWMK